ncbi:antibiotic biosynthesis monooxygenase [Flavobacteriaceae bacterium F08102]|nr:antibiotic biosynthesis monooxygenase [Flavobacteriaceae bacterium F08102]
MIANTPKVPYYAVIFTSILTNDTAGYEAMADLMTTEAKKIDGFLGIESARNTVGITVSYWRDLAAIHQWKEQLAHQLAQKQGKLRWYERYKVRITHVERDYEFVKIN